MLYHDPKGALFWHGKMMPLRNGALCRPGPSTLVLYTTNLKSTVGQYRGREIGPERGGATGKKRGEDQDDEEGDTGQATMPDESQADVSIHGFWKWGTTTTFDMKIFILDAGSYLC